MVLGAEDGVVVADMEIGSIIAELDFLLSRDVLEVDILAGSGYIAAAQDFSLLVCLAGEAAGQNVVAALLSGSKVQGNHIKLHAGTALHEQYLVVISQPHQLKDISLCLVVHRIVCLGAVADFQDGHAGVLEIQKLCLCLF